MTAISTNKTAIFAGSFNPFTIGHASIVERSLGVFDKIIILVGVNGEKAEENIKERVEYIKKIYRNEPRVVVDCNEGLTADYAKTHNIKWLIRGVRNVKDFEYERDMADINRRLGVETLLLPTLPEHAAISSSIVRELQHYGFNPSTFLCP